MPRFQVAARVGEEIGYLMLQAGALWGLGNAKAVLGQSRAAREAWRRSVDVPLRLAAITPGEAAQVLAQGTPKMPKRLRMLHD